MTYELSPDKTILIQVNDNGSKQAFIPDQLQKQIVNINKQKTQQATFADEAIAKAQVLLTQFTTLGGILPS